MYIWGKVLGMATFNRTLKKKMKFVSFRKSHDANRSLAYLGVTITVERINRGMTQAEVAKLAGVSQQHVSVLENGGNVETLTLLKICSVLKISHIRIYD